MSGITKEMVQEFNTVLERKGSIIRLYVHFNTVDIKLIKDDYLKMEDQIVNPTKEFYKDLEKFFYGRGVTISYNNTWSCLWAANLVNVIE